MTTKIWVNFGSSDGLMAVSTKPLPEPMLTYQEGPAKFVWAQFHKRYLSHQPLKLSRKLLLSQISFKYPRGNELSPSRGLYDKEMSWVQYDSTQNWSMVVMGMILRGNVYSFVVCQHPGFRLIGISMLTSSKNENIFHITGPLPFTCESP